MIYTTFAKLYDDLMDPEMYANWLDFAEDEMISGNVLDLACGSGRFAVKLAERGFETSGFDLSEEMLSLALKHAEEAGVDLPLYQGDMLDLSGLSEKFSNVTCFADSFCYLPDEKSVERAFVEVFQHLKPEGKFIFDVITPYQTDVVYPGYMYNYTDEEQAFIWTSFEGKHPHSVEHELTFFIWNEKEDGYDRIEELHYERTYELDVYLKALKNAGFNRVKVSADFGKSKPNEQTTRWFFACQKD